MLERVLPNKMNIWRTKRDKRQEKKRLAREAKLKEWVDNLIIFNYFTFNFNFYVIFMIAYTCIHGVKY